MTEILRNRIKLLFIVLVGVIFGSCNREKFHYKCDVPKNNIEQKVDSVLNLMTLEEKISQLNQYSGKWEFTGPVTDDSIIQKKYDDIKHGRVGAMLNVVGAANVYKAQKLAVENSRLKIPLLFGYDVIHGYQTMMPIPLAQAASWDYNVAETAAKVAAKEAASAGINWTFAPAVDVCRDSRWGRMMESPGEDPFLASYMTRAWIKGFQGDNLSDTLTIAACAKHFAAYGFCEAGRDYNRVDMSMQTLHNMVLPPFKSAVDAGVATIMTSFNELNGAPATANNYLVKQILKRKWNFKGFVVSDWGSIGELIVHGYAKDYKEAAYKALVAGTDMDMESQIYMNNIEKLISSGRVNENILNEAVRRVLTVKIKLGLFDDPYKYCNVKREENELLSKSNLNIARNVARRSIVLLKNENNLLPLKKSGQTIAVIGSLANSKDIPLGNWRAKAIKNSAVSLLEGIQNTVTDKSTVFFSKGYVLTTGVRKYNTELSFVKGDRTGFKKAIELAGKVDVVVLAMGEDCYQSGEGRSQTDIGLKGDQMDLMNEILKVNKNVVVTLMNGRSLAIPELDEKIPAILEVWYLGSQAGNAIADVLFGDYNPSGKLPVSFPRNVGQCPIYYNYKLGGRPFQKKDDPSNVFWSHYSDAPNTPLYPFGYGLSYTKFNYTNLRLDKTKCNINGKITVSVDVTNIGRVEGEEVVQLYIRDLVGSITRPVRELKGFKKIALNAGETKTVSFSINKELLKFYSANNRWVVEPGDFNVWVGGNSNASLKASFKLIK